MFEDQNDVKEAVRASAVVVHELMELYDRFRLSVASAYLSSALDAACAEAGVDRATLTSQFTPRPEA